MPRRIRHHVNPLKLGFVEGLQPELPLRGGRPIEVELGCADAAFLFERAAEDPTRLYVGVEIRAEMVRRVNQRAAGADAPPVRAVFGNVNADLPRLFPRGSVTRFYLNFPDPWFKKRHHKRRILNADLAATLAAALVPDGEVFFQTDVFDLALDAMEVLEREPALANVLRPWAFERASPFTARSRRERQSLRRGRRVWRLRYRRHDG
jgi:tRNA (guanine-N7-)-methyltransferase